MAHTVANIVIEHSDATEAWVYMTYSDDKAVFDKRRCRDRADALKFIRDAYPDSDIHTCARMI